MRPRRMAHFCYNAWWLRTGAVNSGEATLAIRHWVTGTFLALAASMPGASYAQQENVTWAEAVDYVAQHGSTFSFYGPVAKSLGLSDGTTVESRKISEPGDPSRDFFVTSNKVLLTTTWKSGTSPAYAASQEGALLKAMDRNRSIPVSQAAGSFEAEKQWWITAISADKRKAAY